jgi:hypothetical protein
LNDHGDPIRTIGHTGRESQEYEYGKRYQRSPTGDGIDKAYYKTYPDEQHIMVPCFHVVKIGSKKQLVPVLALKREIHGDVSKRMMKDSVKIAEQWTGHWCHIKKGKRKLPTAFPWQSLVRRSRPRVME